jgi:hypothetical protein
MANVPYNYINQPIVATALIQLSDSDSFYLPEENGHTGFAFNGVYYNAGYQGSPPQTASWYTEGAGPYRGPSAPFPSYGLILLGRANLTILDESTPALSLWMTFLLNDNLLLTDNYALDNPNYSPPSLIGYTPSGLAYANGVISVIYSPDAGAEDIGDSPPGGSASTMVVNIDFSSDSAFLDVAV